MRKHVNRFLAMLKNQLDIRYFLTGGLWLSLPVLVNYALGLIRSVAFARLTEQNTYGQFGFINSVAGTLSILTLPGINTALVETVARGNLGSLSDAAGARAKWGLLGCMAMSGVSLYYAYLGQGELAIAFLIAAPLLFLTWALQVVQSYYNGQKRFDMLGMFNVGTVLIHTISVLVILWLQKGLIWLVVAVNGLQLIFCLVFYQLAVRHTKGKPRDPEMIAYGRSLTWAQAFSTVTFYLDSTILGFAASFADVAIYTVASIIPENIKGLMRLLTPLSLPKIAENPEKRVYTHHTRRRLLFLLTIDLGIVLLAIVIIPILMPFLYGERYAISAPYAQLLMISLAAEWPNAFFSAALQARRQTRAIYRANLIYGVLQLSVLLIFVPLWGIKGVILSRIVSRWGIALYQWRAITRI